VATGSAGIGVGRLATVSSTTASSSAVIVCGVPGIISNCPGWPSVLSSPARYPYPAAQNLHGGLTRAVVLIPPLATGQRDHRLVEQVRTPTIDGTHAAAARRPQRSSQQSIGEALIRVGRPLETRTGSWSSTTSPQRWRCCARSSTPAAVPTGSSPWRWNAELARDTEATLAAARALYEWIASRSSRPGPRRPGRHANSSLRSRAAGYNASSSPRAVLTASAAGTQNGSIEMILLDLGQRADRRPGGIEASGRMHLEFCRRAVTVAAV
jgi:hypothetical protein